MVSCSEAVNSELMGFLSILQKASVVEQQRELPLVVEEFNYLNANAVSWVALGF